MQRSKLTKLELYQEGCCYYLRAEYEVETEHRLSKITIPKICLPVRQDVEYSEEVSHYSWMRRFSTNLGFGELEVHPDSNGYCILEEVLKEKPERMTLEEIEKKLGYKVELVSKK